MAQTEQEKRNILADAIRDKLEVLAVFASCTTPVHLNDAGILNLVCNPTVELRIKPQTVMLIIDGVEKELPAPLAQLPASGFVYTPSAGNESGACAWSVSDQSRNSFAAVERGQAFATAEEDAKEWVGAFK